MDSCGAGIVLTRWGLARKGGARVRGTRSSKTATSGAAWFVAKRGPKARAGFRVDFFDVLSARLKVMPFPVSVTLAGDRPSTARRVGSVCLPALGHHFKSQIHCGEHGDEGFEGWIAGGGCGFV
jgi:hypothetical protein